MSRYTCTGIDPSNNAKVNIAFGWDEVPGFRPGYFFQVYAVEGHPKFNPDSENIILNEGFLNGISKEQLDDLKKIWSARKNARRIKN